MILFLLLVSLLGFGIADVAFPAPQGGSFLEGGSLYQLEWGESGNPPPITDLDSYTLFLCIGTNDDYVCPSSVSSLSYSPETNSIIRTKRP